MAHDTLVDILSAVIIVLDLVLSVWNCYSAGLTYGMIKRTGGGRWAYISTIVGLSLGFVGAVYVTAFVVGFVGYILGFVDPGTLDLLLAYNALVTGGLITALGIAVTVQSIYVAVKRPGAWTVLGALYNTFASIWNVFAYMQDFGPLESIINYERRGDRKSNMGTLIVLIILALLLGVLLAFVAFNAGRSHGEGRYLRGSGFASA